MDKISELEKAVLEIGSGAWFLTSIFLVIIFGFYIIQRILWDPQWRYSPTLRAAFALAVFGFGSSIRAGLAWFRFANGDYAGSDWILSWWPWFEASIIMNSLGAAIAVHVLSPGFRSCVSVGIVGVSFIIPALIWYF